MKGLHVLYCFVSLQIFMCIDLHTSRHVNGQTLSFLLHLRKIISTIRADLSVMTVILHYVDSSDLWTIGQYYCCYGSRLDYLHTDMYTVTPPHTCNTFLYLCAYKTGLKHACLHVSMDTAKETWESLQHYMLI